MQLVVFKIKKIMQYNHNMITLILHSRFLQSNALTNIKMYLYSIFFYSVITVSLFLKICFYKKLMTLVQVVKQYLSYI